MKKINVIELFAGVGGFHIGLNQASDKYKIVWSNQWEPSTKSQPASEIYRLRFPKTSHSNKDIASVIEDDFESIPNHDLLVGGFPCQDYSVASTLNRSGGIEGKKGVLWWSIYKILQKKGENKPQFLFLENVDRLIKSPAKQRGRDFAIMLASLSDLGYAVEWRIINAAEYGFPQRRRRIFITAYLQGSSIYKEMINSNHQDWLLSEGIIAEAFPASTELSNVREFEIEGNLEFVTTDFNKNKSIAESPFENAGLMINRKVFTLKTVPDYSGPYSKLSDILIPEKDIPNTYFINEEDLDKWNYLKGGKSEQRVNKASGFTYNYSEGSMVFPDSLDKPSRTIITGEGGASPSRFKHVVTTKSGKFRRLTPVELERLNMFPDNHTKEASDVKRAFFMGNALVVGVIEKIGKSLVDRIKGK
ncbi:DNA (cytosine-5-)-methyltransferase [Sphingobacterium cellulitidis]|uniref:DNA cytosine methyltransferase n=1 Tax=Sphingobacterium cellulitidis TaxID=1768011 RepID=UPI000B93A5A6|nr:DNA (cytosine-5-)-methyltransferase [Sphingobacterium cellulitidis]OYD44641.1 DNA (cytosine-5-)-methyltransferase [Sphingobacterium cellulitidis]